MDLCLENYPLYEELVTTGKQTIYTKDFDDVNINEHWKEIMYILEDGIETPEVQNMKIHVVWPDDEADLYIIQYMWNLMLWPLITCANTPIMSSHLFFERVVNKKCIKTYIDRKYPFIHKESKYRNFNYVERQTKRLAKQLKIWGS